MKLVHDTKSTGRALRTLADNAISVFAQSTNAQGIRIARALQRWNLQYYDTGLMYDSWEYIAEPDGVTFVNLTRYSGFNGRASEARSVVFSELDLNDIASEVADG